MSVDEPSGGEPGPDGPDWEQIARREIYSSMYETGNDVAQAFNALAHKIDEGDEIDGDDIQDVRSALQDADEFLAGIAGKIAGEAAPGDELNDELVMIGRGANDYLTEIAKRRADGREPPASTFRQGRALAYDMLDALDDAGAPPLDDERARGRSTDANPREAVADGGRTEGEQ